MLIYIDEEVQLTTLRWIDSFFDISPEDILQFVPRLLSQVLPAVSSDMDSVRTAANRVNNSLKDYIDSTVEDEIPKQENLLAPPGVIQPPPVPPKDPVGIERRESAISQKTVKTLGREQLEPRAAESKSLLDQSRDQSRGQSQSPMFRDISPRPGSELDYEGCVNALTLQFLNEHVDTRVTALGWLIMLHHKAPRKVR